MTDHLGGSEAAVAPLSDEGLGVLSRFVFHPRRAHGRVERDASGHVTKIREGWPPIAEVRGDVLHTDRPVYIPVVHAANCSVSATGHICSSHAQASPGSRENTTANTQEEQDA